MSTHKMTSQPCPKCNNELDAASSVNDERSSFPKSGDITICFYCGTVLIYADDGQMVDTPALVEEAMIELAIEDPATAARLQELRHFILRRKIDR